MSSSAHSKVSHRSPTAFETRVYQACSLIPQGKVSTYGILAHLLESSPRAVGQALRRNPFAPKVPCHRVVSTTLNIGGFKGTWGAGRQIDHKRELLVEEHVAFDNDCTISKTAVTSLEELHQLWTNTLPKADAN